MVQFFILVNSHNPSADTKGVFCPRFPFFYLISYYFYVLTNWPDSVFCKWIKKTIEAMLAGNSACHIIRTHLEMYFVVDIALTHTGR